MRTWRYGWPPSGTFASAFLCGWRVRLPLGVRWFSLSLCRPWRFGVVPCITRGSFSIVLGPLNFYVGRP